MGVFDYYLVIINIMGFIMFLVNIWLYTYTKDGQVDVFLTLISLFGGSIGILMAILLFDRKAVKENMMSRVFISCIFVIQVILFLFIKGYYGGDITFAFIDFLANHKMFVAYIAVINCMAFIVYAIDKFAAVKKKKRVRIISLLGLAFLGGTVGAFLAMYCFRHKTRKDYFTVGIPLMMIMQTVVIFYAMNFGI